VPGASLLVVGILRIFSGLTIRKTEEKSLKG